MIEHEKITEDQAHKAAHHFADERAKSFGESWNETDCDNAMRCFMAGVEWARKQQSESDEKAGHVY